VATEPKAIRELFKKIANCLPNAVSLKANVFRSAGVKYANEQDIISGDGASQFGGRWNRRGIRAIYLSLDLMTAVKESYQAFLESGFNSSSIRPRVMAGAELNVRSLLDLTDAKIRKVLGFTLVDLTGEDWHAIQDEGEESWTQAISRGAKLAGFEGLIVPSARNHRGKNVVLFPENLPPGSVELMAKKELPPHPSEWP
jgi:RES domain-containing protein